MKSFILISFTLLVFAQNFKEEGNVLLLNSFNIDQAISQYPRIFIFFYSPSCSHCISLQPIFTEAAKILKQQSQPIKLAKIDATTQEEAAKKYKVNNYPSLKFIQKGIPQIEYKGSRKSPQVIADWLIKKSSTPSISVNTEEQFTNIINKYHFVAFFFGESNQDADFFVFNKLANLDDKIIWAHSFNSEIKKFAKVSDDVQLVFFKQFDERINEYRGQFKFQTIQEYINIFGVPQVVLFDDDTREILFEKKKPGLILFTNNRQDGLQNWREIAKELRNGIYSKFQFVYSHQNDGTEYFEKIGEFTGSSATNLPNVALIRSDWDKEKFILKGQITLENVKKFLSQNEQSRDSKYNKSENVDIGFYPVKRVTSDSFKQIVLERKSDFLLLYYSQWQQKSMLVLQQLYFLGDSIENVEIGSIDCFKNDINVELDDIPSLYLYKKESTIPIKYNGDLSEESIVQFLKSHFSYYKKSIDL